jgi:hypothetical protein
LPILGLNPLDLLHQSVRAFCVHQRKLVRLHDEMVLDKAVGELRLSALEEDLPVEEQPQCQQPYKQHYEVNHSPTGLGAREFIWTLGDAE